MKITLVNPYELGRQPFGLAEPAAWLREAGFEVVCLDLSVDRLDAATVRGSAVVAIYVAMHTATRIALEALPKIRALAPGAHLVACGLYAPMNDTVLREGGVHTVLGGEFEPDLLSVVKRLEEGAGVTQTKSSINLGKIDFRVPDRSGLPTLERYAQLVMPDGTTRVMGFAEASRGCKHLCRHCPVVPVYAGRFRVVPIDVVLGDIAQQVESGAEHISFGDPDFLNGPTHAARLVTALHERFPRLTYDATIKVQHLIGQRAMLGLLRDTGCLFVTSAVEAVDDGILMRLAKNHSRADFEHAVAIMRDARIALAPTFVAFNPWITLQGYVELLARLVTLGLVESVPPIQLAIRLLVPAGSYLLRLPGFADLLQPYDGAMLGYPWKHADPRVDALQSRVQEVVGESERLGLSRRDTFTRVWNLAHSALERDVPALPALLGRPIPHHSEPWYCCAEPTDRQLDEIRGQYT